MSQRQPANSVSVPKGTFDKVGYCVKIGARRKSWRRRVFALSLKRKFLMYFRSDAAYNAYVTVSSSSSSSSSRTV
jgi:hypothetical protein